MVPIDVGVGSVGGGAIERFLLPRPLPVIIVLVVLEVSAVRACKRGRGEGSTLPETVTVTSKARLCITTKTNASLWRNRAGKPNLNQELCSSEAFGEPTSTLKLRLQFTTKKTRTTSYYSIPMTVAFPLAPPVCS